MFAVGELWLVEPGGWPVSAEVFWKHILIGLAHLLTLNRHRDGKSAGTGCADEEIVRDLESTLEQFTLIGEDLGEG